MTGLSAAPVIGNAPIQPGHTSSTFGAFVILALGTPPPPPTPTPTPTAPRIDAIAPASAPAAGGAIVTISGAGFDPGATVQLGGAPATVVTVVNSTTIRVALPTHAPATIDVAVTSAGQQVVRPAAFRYDPVPPHLGPAAVSGAQVRLEWEPGGGTPVLRYGIVAGMAPGASEFGPFPVGLATEMNSSVGPGRYYARVLAETTWGLLSSNELIVDVGVPTVPGAPTLSPAVIRGRSVTLSWTAASGNPITYAVIARYAAAGPPITAVPVAGTWLTVEAPPGAYVVSVVGVNALGVGAESNRVALIVP